MADLPEDVRLAPGEREAVQRVIDDLEDAKRQHDGFVAKVEKWYRSYRGVLEKQSEAAQWTSKNHPPYAYQLIEANVANMIDDKTVFSMRPQPIIDDFASIEEYVQGARALENLIKYELRIDRFQAKQRPNALQVSIAGISPVKIAWDYQVGTGRRFEPQVKEIRHPQTDEVIGAHTVMVEQTHTRVKRDGPTFGVIDVRDFFWPDNDEDVQSAVYIIHRVWMSIDELRELAAQGLYRQDAVDNLGETRDIADWEKTMWRSDELFMTNRKRRMVEVLERHGRDGRITVVANRTHLLRDIKPDDNPFWHGKKPFLVFSASPQPFQFVGYSDMEAISQLQNALWTSMNQTADNVALLNNAIVILRDTADDQDYEFAPGEFWTVEDPSEVQMWQPNALPAEVATQYQGSLRADLQNITGGLGLMAGVDSQIDSKTATGVSTFTSLAQRRLATRKAQFGYSFEDAGNMMIELCQQFLSADRMIPIIGKQGYAAWERVAPQQIQGYYACEVEAISESLMRQERRAEAQALFTLALQAAPLAAAAGSPFNFEQLFKDLLYAFDKDDCDKYFSAAPQPQLEQGGSGAPTGPPGAAGPPQLGAPQLRPAPQGVTAPQAASMTSPSHQVSQSPAVFLQRAKAMRGAGRTV